MLHPPYVDKKGAFAIEPAFSSVGYFLGDLALVVKDGKSGFIDRTGKTVIEPIYDSALVVPPERRVECSLPVTFIKFRYAHHASPSGYSRICDYVDTPKVELSSSMYWLGETLFRPFCRLSATRSGPSWI